MLQRIKDIGVWVLVVGAAKTPMLVVLTGMCCTEDEIARTQKNKATNSHLMRLKARLSQLRTKVRPALVPLHFLPPPRN